MTLVQFVAMGMECPSYLEAPPYYHSRWFNYGSHWFQKCTLIHYSFTFLPIKVDFQRLRKISIGKNWSNDHFYLTQMKNRGSETFLQNCHRPLCDSCTWKLNSWAQLESTIKSTNHFYPHCVIEPYVDIL